MNQAPFPNKYLLKAVAESDAKSCYVCYKPTPSVLLSENKGDFFYVCGSHLKDEGFCLPVESEEYVQLVGEKKAIEESLEKNKKEIDENRSYSWDRLKSNLPVFGKKEAEPRKDSDDNAKPLTKEQKYDQLVKINAEERKKLDEVKGKISSFKFKEYTLDKNIYKVRVQNYFKSKMRQKKVQEMHRDGFFPSVPKSNIGN